MVLRHFGLRFKHSALKVALGTTYKDGTHETRICELLLTMGLRAEVVTLSFSRLRKVLAKDGIVLASVDGDDHYIVVHGVTATSVHLADPLDYRPWKRVVSHDDFLDRWDRWGVVVYA